MSVKVMKTPRSVDLAITNMCNLRCKYCSHFTSPSEVGSDLPPEEWLKFFEELGRCAVMEICIQGGEPFVREDLRELIEGIVANRMRFTILSNGTLITDEWAEYLASTGRCDQVQVSIDGSTPIVHDSFRGEGSFIRAIEGVKSLGKHNVTAHVRVTIHKQNVRDLDEIAELLLDEMGLPDFSTNHACYMGLCRQNAELVQLTTEERSIAMETLLNLNTKYNGRIIASAGPLSEAISWSEMEKARRDGEDAMPGRGRLVSCGGAMRNLAVRADGVIVPCVQMGHIELGRINRDDTYEVWQNHPDLNRLRERRNIPLSEFEFCDGCEYINYCTGGCPAEAYTLTGDEYVPSPNDCIRRFLMDGGRLPQ